MDVEGLYTNIPHIDGIQAIKNTITDPSTASLAVALTEFVLTHNYFKFNGGLYLQTNGTAMGTRMAPQYANIFMADFEKRFLSTQTLSPLLYVRFIDDIFMVWTHRRSSLDEFHRDINQFHSSIKLTIESSPEKSIPQYEEVIVFRLGRMQKSKGHGLIFILPCIDTLHRVDMRMRSFSVPPQQVITKDGAIVEMGANIYFHISSVGQSVTSVQDLNYSSRVLFQTALTKLLARKKLAELDVDKTTVCTELQRDANAGASTWGVEVTRVEIPQIKVLKEPNPPRMGSMMFPPGMADAVPAAFQQLTEVFMAATAPGKGGHILQPGASIANKVSVVESTSAPESVVVELTTPAELLAAVRRVLNETLVKQVDAVYQFEVSGDDTGTYYLDLKHNGGSVGEGRPPGGDPDATLSLDLEDMKAMFSQQLNPLQAYMSGRLRVSGDLSAAMKLEDLLKRLNGKNMT